MTQIFRTEKMNLKEIRVGAVVRFPARDGSFHAFGDTLIAEVNETKQTCLLFRPYSYVFGSASTNTEETYSCPFKSLLENAVLVYDGSRPANLNYDLPPVTNESREEKTA